MKPKSQLNQIGDVKYIRSKWILVTKQESQDQFNKEISLLSFQSDQTKTLKKKPESQTIYRSIHICTFGMLTFIDSYWYRYSRCNNKWQFLNYLLSHQLLKVGNFLSLWTLTFWFENETLCCINGDAFFFSDYVESPNDWQVASIRRGCKRSITSHVKFIINKSTEKQICQRKKHKNKLYISSCETFLDTASWRVILKLKSSDKFRWKLTNIYNWS